MFQYAAGRAVALARGVPLVLSTSVLTSPRRDETPRRYELDALSIESDLCTPTEEREISAALRLHRLIPWISRWKVCEEREPGFQRGVLEAPDHTILRGYWQSEKYFLQCAELISREFQLREPPRQHVEQWRAHMRSVDSVSVHVRRGDYVSSRAAACFHGSLSLDYYARAIDNMCALVSSPSFFIFTDDVQWCKDQLRNERYETHHVSGEASTTACEDLALMRSCKHHIIANSSFSWWGAWLARKDRSGPHHVIAPRRWFAHGLDAAAIADRFPSHWRVL